MLFVSKPGIIWHALQFFFYSTLTIRGGGGEDQWSVWRHTCTSSRACDRGVGLIRRRRRLLQFYGQVIRLVSQINTETSVVLPPPRYPPLATPPEQFVRNMLLLCVFHRRCRGKEGWLEGEGEARWLGGGSGGRRRIRYRPGSHCDGPSSPPGPDSAPQTSNSSVSGLFGLTPTDVQSIDVQYDFCFMVSACRRNVLGW